jgi:prepilin-type N-terminal cleavage/methylation domain-containing protein
MCSLRHKYSGFTLLELLIVLAIIGILVGAILPMSNPSILDQLRSAAQIVSTELAYGRSLAMANGSKYTYTFDTTNNKFILQHSGTDTTLDTLPNTPFSSKSDTLTQHIVCLQKLPHIGTDVQLATVTTGGSSPQKIDNLEFTPLGATTRSQSTVVWLSAGGKSGKRYVAITVNPVTGLCTVGSCIAVSPL